MAFINAVATVLPPFELTQEKVREMGRTVLKGKVPFLENALNLFTNAGVSRRFLVRDIDEILANDRLGWRNQVYAEAMIELGGSLARDLFEKSGLAPGEIDLIITTSCTGFMIPSVDAHLINEFGMRPDIKRLPLTELGCAAGAMALSRAADYLQAFPDHRVMILAVELPSLTYRTRDFRPANLVSAALFGDGGGGAILSGRPGPCKILERRTHFYPNSLEMMGFDLSEHGFKIILDKKISQVVANDFLGPLTAFLSDQGLTAADIRHHVFHPGGRKIMDTLGEILALDEGRLAASRGVLRDAGNLSSASVLWVLKRVLESEPEGLGLMVAFGPGFNAEMLTLNFTK